MNLKKFLIDIQLSIGVGGEKERESECIYSTYFGKDN